MNRTSKIRVLANALAVSLSGHRIGKKIAYLHIPKCGGTSLHYSIASKYGLSALLTPNNIIHLNSVASAFAAQRMGKSIGEFRDEIVGYYFAHPAAKFISGHFHFDSSSCKLLSEGWSFITLLRDPVPRFVSAFYYNKYLPDFPSPYHLQKSSPAAKDGDFYIQRLTGSLEEFVYMDEALKYGCDMVRQIASCDANGFGVTDAEINNAINFLEGFEVVGLLEHMDDFVADFYGKFGVKLAIPHLNFANKKSVKLDQLPVQVVDRIREICEPNIKVYEHFKNKIAR
ncbi:MAG: sulfotransferase family 2 domain-containing protein [Sideroxyarcus sp.]|nr:sulfotransferase family 2 domain-containing protein [Sideroxyarcus sp.]